MASARVTCLFFRSWTPARTIIYNEEAKSEPRNLDINFYTFHGEMSFKNTIEPYQTISFKQKSCKFNAFVQLSFWLLKYACKIKLGESIEKKIVFATPDQQICQRKEWVSIGEAARTYILTYFVNSDIQFSSVSQV